MDIRNSILERCFKRIIRLLIEEIILTGIKVPTKSTDQLKPPILVPERICGGKPCSICYGLLQFS